MLKRALNAVTVYVLQVSFICVSISCMLWHSLLVKVSDMVLA